MTGLDAASAVFDSPVNGIFAFNDSMTWDSVGKNVYHAGRGHGTDPAVFTRYNDTTNTWTRVGNVVGCPGGLGHPYDHNTIDQTNRVFYYRCNDSNTYVSYNIATSTWSSFAGPSGQTIPQGGVAWFPERNGLFYTFGPGNAVYFYTGGSWTNLGNYAQGQDTGAFAQYNQNAQVVLFGGGTACPCNKIYRYNSNGTITALTDAPVNLSINVAYISSDPASTKFLVLYRSGGTTATNFYSVDTAGSGTWTSLTLPPFASGIDGNTGIGQTPISSYGVTLFCTYNQGGNARCYIYKLTASAPTLPYAMPTIADETAAYASFGWSLQAPYATSTYNSTTITEDMTYIVTGNQVSVHDESEGDDLWGNANMSRRGGSSMYSGRATQWLSFFKGDYVNCNPTSPDSLCQDIGGGDTMATVCPNKGCASLTYSGDHMTGWGLVDNYQLTGDAGSLTAATTLGTWIELYYSDKFAGHCIACWSIRMGARHLMLATRLAEATNLPRWITLRDKILTIWQNDPTWDNVGKMYSMNSAFDGDSTAWALLGTTTPVADGWRGVGTFQVSMISDAFYHAYRTTGQSWIKDRMVMIAQNIQANALNPAWGNGVGRGGITYFWNIKTGAKAWYGAAGGSAGYTLTLTNALVLGYKYSGNTALMDLAKHVFAQGSKFDLDGTRFCSFFKYTCDANPDNDPVHHYVNTIKQTAGGNPTIWLYYMKGELQYTYFLFENGGNPTVEGTGPVAPTHPVSFKISQAQKIESGESIKLGLQ